MEWEGFLRSLKLATPGIWEQSSTTATLFLMKSHSKKNMVVRWSTIFVSEFHWRRFKFFTLVPYFVGFQTKRILTLWGTYFNTVKVFSMSFWCLFDFCLPYCGLLNLEVRPHDSYGLDVLHLEVWISSDLWKTSHVSMQWIFDHGWFFHLHIHWVTLNIFSVLYTYIYTILLW